MYAVKRSTGSTASGNGENDANARRSANLSSMFHA